MIAIHVEHREAYLPWEGAGAAQVGTELDSTIGTLVCCIGEMGEKTTFIEWRSNLALPWSPGGIPRSYSHGKRRRCIRTDGK